MIQTTVAACIFRKTETSPWERGIMIGEGKAIVDKNYKILDSVWTYKIYHDQGCFLTELG